MPGGQFLSLEGKLGGQTGDKIMKLTAKKQPTKKTSAKIASKINTWLSGVYEGIFADVMIFFSFALLSDAESNICKYNAVIINDITLFWRDKSYAEGRLRDRKLARICKWSCRPKKKKQTSENMAMRFFANSHLLTRIFAHSCIRCEASAFVLQSLSLQIAFSCSFLFSSLQMFIL